MSVKTVGITGGIGSGKTTICKIINQLGYPVFIADEEAKKIYKETWFVNLLIEHWGDKILTNDKIDFKKIAAIIFNDKNELNWIDSEIHPWVGKQFNLWKAKQKSKIVFKESAILLETSKPHDCDYVITVVVPEEIRIKRVLKRDKGSIEDIKFRINNQKDDTFRVKNSDFMIDNNNKIIVPQVLKIINQILK